MPFQSASASCSRFSLPRTQCWMPGTVPVTGPWITWKTVEPGSPGRTMKKRGASTSRSIVPPTPTSPSACLNKPHVPQRPRLLGEALGPVEVELVNRPSRGDSTMAVCSTQDIGNIWARTVPHFTAWAHQLCLATDWISPGSTAEDSR